MRRLLDRTYLAAGWVAAASILGISLLVSAQVLLNLSTRVLHLPLPSTIPSYADFAGFMLAAATFLAMPYTFRSGAHIRVLLVTSRLPERVQNGVELIVLAVAAGLIGFALWYVVALVLESVHFGDLSPGIIPVPLWIPQTAMAIGLALLLVAVIDSFIETLRRGETVIIEPEEV